MWTMSNAGAVAFLAIVAILMALALLATLSLTVRGAVWKKLRLQRSRKATMTAARGSDGRRPRKSPLHRLDLVHVGCKKLAPALASMDDKRMLHPFRALAPDLK
jgi:heme exporter protein D